MSESPVYVAELEDDMLDAFEKARTSFKYFWREMSWEYRRIIPGLELAAVKAPFSDPSTDGEEPYVEQMWITDVDFDGVNVKGTLMNSPNELKSVKEGDEVSILLSELSDWMYVTEDQVFGGYTINSMRKNMGSMERRSHDSAWGLDFGDPNTVAHYPTGLPEPKKKGFFVKIFSKSEQQENPYEGIDMEIDHPAALNLKEGFDQALTEDPSAVHEPVAEGWTLLHMQALAGSRSCVEVLLKHGAKKDVTTPLGHTPLDLARILGWTEVEKLLTN